jgi:hypothetical protein
VTELNNKEESIHSIVHTCDRHRVLPLKIDPMKPIDDPHSIVENNHVIRHDKNLMKWIGVMVKYNWQEQLFDRDTKTIEKRRKKIKRFVIQSWKKNMNKSIAIDPQERLVDHNATIVNSLVYYKIKSNDHHPMPFPSYVGPNLLIFALHTEEYRYKEHNRLSIRIHIKNRRSRVRIRYKPMTRTRTKQIELREAKMPAVV